MFALRPSRPDSPRRQRGAVAVITGLAALLLVSVLGLVVDLGHAYVGTSELQNAADAAALAGARELNQTQAGVTAAIARAIDTAAEHHFDFSTPLVISAANIRLGNCPHAANANNFGRPSSQPSTCTFVPASSVTSDAAAAGLTFLEVDTGSLSLATYFMRVAGSTFNNVVTAGYAVAGRFVNDVTPIGVCAIDPATRTAKYTYATGDTELVEFGYRRGVTYNLFELNPLAGGPSDPYLINPVDTPAAGCSPAHSSAAFTAPFVCNGNSTVLATGSGGVFTNTGMTTALEASLNSRFDIFGGASVCDPVAAPPDANIKHYRCRNPSPSGDPACINNPTAAPSVTPPIDWMEPGGSTQPAREAVAVDPTTRKPLYKLPSTSATPDLAFEQYGVLWSHGPAYHAGATNPPQAGAPFTPSQANATTMYSTVGTAVTYFDITRYPASSTPYASTSGPYFQAPTRPGKRERRMLNLVLVDCRTPPTGSASCGAMTAVGIGRFFMQAPAVFSGGPGKRYLDVEFSGLVAPVPTTEIKLYR